MAIRATPEQYYGTSANVQTQVPVMTQPAAVYVQAPIQLPQLNGTAIFVLSLVAVVGLVGLFAVLASANRCRS